MKKSAKFIAIVLATVLALSCFCIPGLAVSGRYSDGGKFSVERISNPGQSAGQPDGLVAGTDRGNSYAWSMNQLKDENGHYIYIGTNRNLLYSLLSGMASQLPGSPSQEYIKTAVDMVTNGELDTSDEGNSKRAMVVRYNTETKKMEIYLDGTEHTDKNDPFYGIFGFRASVAFNDSLYFNAMRRVDGVSKSLIFRITSNAKNAEPEVVYNEDGGNMRAMCVSEDGDTMFLGGTDILPDDLTNFGVDYGITVLKTTKEESELKPIADSKDFEHYEKAEYLTSGGDVWDMVEYKGELIMTLMTSHGAICFKAHEAKEGEEDMANEYGWVWTEFVGETHGEENGAPYGAGFGNPLNYVASPYIFKDDLYFIASSDAMDAEIYGTMGLFAALYSSKNINTFFDGLGRMESAMDNESSVFRYTNKGEMQMVVGDKKMCPENIKYVAVKKAGFNADDYSTTQYNWRAEIYNGKLYIGTFDAYPMYKYLTRLTNGDLLGMTVEEASTQLQYAINFLKLLKDKAPNEVKSAKNRTTLASRMLSKMNIDIYYSKIMDGLSKTKLGSLIDGLNNLKASLSNQATAASAQASLIAIDATILPLTVMKDTMRVMLKYMPKKLRDIMEPNCDSLAYICKVFGNVNREGLKRYIRVSNTIAANMHPGFELYCTSDGINYDAITIDGFGDEYNYGVRTIITCEDGLYVGTANPFFGAQLWRVTDSTAK